MNADIQKNIAEDPEFKLLVAGFTYENDKFFNHRTMLLNFFGMIILGATLLIVQPDLVDECIRNAIIAVYFLSIMLLILSKYLFVACCRQSKDKSLKKILNHINKFFAQDSTKNTCDSHNSEDSDENLTFLSIIFLEKNQIESYEYNAVIFAFLSIVLFLFGTIIGFYELLNFWWFIVSLLISIYVLWYFYSIEFSKTRC